MKKVAAFLGKMTGWNDRPADVFFIAIPLFLFGIGSMFYVAVSHWVTSGDYGYFVSMSIVLSICGYPLYRMSKMAIDVSKGKNKT